MGGKAGEMSTLMNYFFQSFNFRGRDEYRPYYELVANIAAEEWGHVELVACAINLLLTGHHHPRQRPDRQAPRPTPSRPATRTTSSPPARTRLPMDSMGNWWNGSYVHSSGNLRLDLVHNFFLGAERPGHQAEGLRDDQRPDGPRADRLPAGARQHARHRLRQGAGDPLRRRRGVETLPDPRAEHAQVPRGPQVRREGPVQHDVQLQPGGHLGGRDLEGARTPTGPRTWWSPNDPIPTLASPPAHAEPQVAAPEAPGIEPGFIQEVAHRIFGPSIST